MPSSSWSWNAGPALLPSRGYSRGRGSLARMCFVDSGKVFNRVPHMSCGGVLQGCVRGVRYQVYNCSSSLAGISQICSLWELDFYEQNF